MIKADYLVIGSGIAVLSFALKACKIGTVSLITKKTLFDSATGKAQGGIACVIDKDDNYSVLTLDSCDYEKDFREFLYNFFEDTTKADIDNVIVDLRNNGGGNSMVANEFILYYQL